MDNNLTLLANGITPAYAGKTHYKVWKSHSFKDHPRIRGKDHEGEQSMKRLSGSPPHTRERLMLNVLGSPPHTRERLILREAEALKPRITPAYAGKTWRRQGILHKAQDHPRIRGKDIFIGR